MKKPTRRYFHLTPKTRCTEGLCALPASRYGRYFGLTLCEYHLAYHALDMQRVWAEMELDSQYASWTRSDGGEA
jgi:hypothetical protein